MTVAFFTPVPLGSRIVPAKVPAMFWAGSRKAASGSRRHRAKNAVNRPVLRDTWVRLIDGLSIAVNLLSRVVGRAMQSAADQLRAEFSRVLARSSSKLAYSEGSTPEFRTESSQARSLSCRKRRAAVPTRG